MTLRRMDNVGVVVESLDAAISFFAELGLELVVRVRTRIIFTFAAALSAAVAAFHLLFALANLGLASEEEGPSVPLAEGALSLVASIALAAAAVLLFRRRLFRASVVALAGASPLPIFFAFTVPEHSGWPFLFGSLVVPAVAGVTAVRTVRRRRNFTSSL